MSSVWRESPGASGGWLTNSKNNILKKCRSVRKICVFGNEQSCLFNSWPVVGTKVDFQLMLLL